jgi:antitoxin component of MazEF toxin-antitoxin module
MNSTVITKWGNSLALRKKKKMVKNIGMETANVPVAGEIGIIRRNG